MSARSFSFSMSNIRLKIRMMNYLHTRAFYLDDCGLSLKCIYRELYMVVVEEILGQWSDLAASFLIYSQLKQILRIYLTLYPGFDLQLAGIV